MPELPIRRLQAGPAPTPQRASAVDFGAGIGAARQQRAGVFDQVAEASERILAAREGARSSRALSEAQLELEAFGDSLQSDPDENTHEERYEKAQREIREKYSKGLFGAWQGDFTERFEGLAERGRMRVRDDVRVRRIDATLADGEQTLTNLERLAARAEGAAQDEVLAQAAAELGRLRGINAISEQAMQKRLQAFKENAAAGWWRGGKNEDPEGTLAELQARGGLARFMDESQRQVAIEEVQNELAQRERFAKAEAAAAKVLEKEAKREREEQVTSEGMGLLLNGQLTVDWIRQNRERLSRTEIDYFLGETRRGAPRAGSIPEPAEWQRLVELQVGDPQRFIEERIDPAKVGPTEWRKLVEAQQKLRKGDASAASDIRVVARRRAVLREGLSKQDQFELQRSMEAALEDFERTKGGKSTPKEREAVLDTVELQRYREGGWFSGDSLAPPTAAIEIPGVDPQDVQDAIRQLQRAGARVTPETIQAKLEEMAQ